MKKLALVALLTILIPLCASSQGEKPRSRDIGITIGVLDPGPLNAITDVTGVRVGHTTLIQGDSIRTGVTVVSPHDDNPFQHKVPAAIVVGNGFGKLIGATQVQELGMIETPIALTNTLNVWTVADALAQYVLSLPGNENVRSVNPIVGETNDGFLNDIRGRHVGRDHVFQAIAAASGGAVAEGSVGAGTGTRCFDWKGGIGTSSRRLPVRGGGYTVGVLVQTNYGGMLDLAGVPVGRELRAKRHETEESQGDDGSCMIVVATDAPLSPHNLTRLARRAPLALGRTGSVMQHASGDYVIAFSTAPEVRIRPGSPEPGGPDVQAAVLSALFQAVVEATEEAILNSLLQATTVRGQKGRVVRQLPLEEVKTILKRYGRSAD
jgi:D-aminopeptidase